VEGAQAVKIACLSHTVLARGYGTERAVVGLSGGLARLGHDVTLISIAPGADDVATGGFAASLARSPFAHAHVPDPDGRLFARFRSRRAVHRAPRFRRPLVRLRNCPMPRRK